MDAVFEFFRRDSEYKALTEGISDKHIPCMVNGMCDSARPFFMASLRKDLKKRGLAVVSDEKEASRLCERLSLLGERAVYYPARDYVFENVGAYSKEWEQKRIAVLKSVLDGDFDFIVTTPDALSQETIPREKLLQCCFTLSRGQRISMSEVRKRLSDCGYAACDVVEAQGQYAVRGGILDFFSPQDSEPVRVDFFGDEIDLIGSFELENQRRTENRSVVSVLPCREVIADESACNAIIDELTRLISKCRDDKAISSLRRELEDLRGNRLLPFADRFFSFIYNRKECLLDYLGKDIVCFIIETQKVKERKHAFDWTLSENITSLAESGCCSFSSPASALMGDAFIGALPALTVAVDLFVTSGKLLDYKAQYAIAAKAVNGFGSKLDMLFDELREDLDANQSILLLCRSHRSAEIMLPALVEQGIPCARFDDAITPNAVSIGFMNGGSSLGGGFSLPRTGFTLITDEETAPRQAVGRRHIKSHVSNGERIASYADLSEGDIVVHANHGIGKYAGVRNLVTEGVSRDFIKIVYADNGILYVPCDQLDLVSKYIGGSETVKLSKMGTSDWQKAKARARAAAQDIAAELIRLYAERQSKRGFAFPPDDELQDEFEAEFEYADTDGQVRASEEIKRDMELDRPMDRLLCGDVGFGKTEVSLRAAFKCVFAGKQCALLVPTTILALQHYQTLLSRFRGYPVKIAMLSRFVPKAEQAKTIAELARGGVDIVVGTHRLLQKDIKFDDLGLLIVDEEQRFGVKHKETIKMLAQNTDVLTLTATPIPRTLNMALSGVRDMSVLEEAPTDRVPVQTYVLEHDDAVIDEAIARELRRGGQVFYLHNNVESIESCAMRIANRFPDAAVAIGHGKMDKDQLSDVWAGMVRGEIDILVCTTIIETGVNVPNANTLIIENADRMGLSQLHQIRGRVGRSTRKGYAYFTFRAGSIMNEIAAKRLDAIREFTEFGSGFKIAMRDLELRGAGNLLGAEQSGHMESVGYDLYIKILEDAVNEMKGEPVKETKSCTLDVLVDSYIPDEYIYSPKLRMDIYRKIAHISGSEEFDDLFDELTDRFGDIPAPVISLMNVSLVRNYASIAGFRLIEQKEGVLFFYHDSLDMARASKAAAAPGCRGRLLLNAGSRPHLAFRIAKGESILDDIRLVLNVYSQ